MKVFLTGATGLLGGHILRALIAEHHEVVVLTRQKLPDNLSHFPNVKTCSGDLSDRLFLQKELEGMDAVIHAAADVSMNLRLKRRQFETNVKGVVTLAKASAAAGIHRFVYISTAGVFKGGSPEHPGAEHGRLSGAAGELPYIRTKFAAEQFLLNEFRKHHFPCVILNPAFMIGPEDRKPSSGQLILAILRKRLFFFPAGGKNLIDVRDVAAAAVNALTKGRIGENYILANANVSYRDFFEMVREAAEMKTRFFASPLFMTRVVGLMGSLIEIWTGRPMQVNHLTAKVSEEKHYLSSEKAKRELGLQVRPIEETIKETVQWFKLHFIGKRAMKEHSATHAPSMPMKEART